MSGRRRRTQRTNAESTAGASRLDHLVVMRESARYDHMLMEGMIAQTLAKVAHLPGAAELREAGIDVVKNPDRWGATTRRVGGSHMVMVERDGVLYLYSMGSAAKNDFNDTNAFVSELVNIVNTYRPRDSWVAAFTRLLRSADHVGDLLRAFSEHTQSLHCEAEINVATPEGRMLFQVLAMIAAMERDYIVRRHTAGRVAQWRRGEWIPNAYPPGYRIEGRRLVIDDSMVDAVRRMLLVLSDRGLTPTETIARVGGLGIATPKIIQIHGERATIADARNPSQAVQNLVGWVDLYSSGHHETLWPNPFPGVPDIAGLQVEEMDGYRYGVLRLVQEVPLPEGGWADQATFDAIRERSASPSPTGGASHTQAPPLSGMFRFADESYEYGILANKAYYRLIQRPLLEERPFTGWKSEVTDDSECVGWVSRSEWHRSIADRVLAAIEAGLPAELDADHFQAFGSLPPLDGRRARLRAVRRQLDDAIVNLGRAQRNARLAADDESAALFVADVKRYHSEKTRLEQELATAETELDFPGLEETFETNAELFAHALAALASTELQADSSLREALRTVISGERWWLEGDTIGWELNVELPHSQGTVLLGPVRGHLTNRLPPQDRTNKMPRSKLVTVEGLVELGLGKRAAQSAAACPHPDLTNTLRAHLAGDPYPAGVDPIWADHVVDVYTDHGFRWNLGHWRLADDLRRRALQVVTDAGGRLSRHEIFQAGIKPEQLRYLSRQTHAPSGEPILQRVGKKNGDNTIYGPLPCPHCTGTATHSIVTPETAPGVLCPACWRAPRPDSPTFPDWYRT